MHQTQESKYPKPPRFSFSSCLLWSSKRETLIIFSPYFVSLSVTSMSCQVKTLHLDVGSCIVLYFMRKKFESNEFMIIILWDLFFAEKLKQSVDQEQVKWRILRSGESQIYCLALTYGEWEWAWPCLFLSPFSLLLWSYFHHFYYQLLSQAFPLYNIFSILVHSNSATHSAGIFFSHPILSVTL